MNILKPERCFSHPSATCHFNLLRLENRLAEETLFFSAERFNNVSQTFHRSRSWRETERWLFYPSFRNTLYVNRLLFIL